MLVAAVESVCEQIQVCNSIVYIMVGAHVRSGLKLAKSKKYVTPATESYCKEAVKTTLHAVGLREVIKVNKYVLTVIQGYGRPHTGKMAMYFQCIFNVFSMYFQCIFLCIFNVFSQNMYFQCIFNVFSMYLGLCTFIFMNTLKIH